MVFFNYSTMQMAAKVVYYGPGLCGKTTNLHWIYSKTSNGSRGEMVSLETETDRTLFFDLLPIDVGQIAGFTTRIQLYTVPGQVFYNTTRKLVLKGVDGVVFVADSQRAMRQANIDSFHNLEENLDEMGLSIHSMPLALQYNKRDLPDIATIAELNQDLNSADWPFFEATAIQGKGVFETLKGISRLTLLSLKQRLLKGTESGAPSVQPKTAAPVPPPVAAAPAPSAPAAAPTDLKPAPPPAAAAEPAKASPPTVASPAPGPTPAPASASAKPMTPSVTRRRVNVESELARLRKEALSPTQRTNGRAGELSRSIALTLNKEDFQRARRVKLSLQVEDEDNQVVDAVRGLRVDLENPAALRQVLLNLKIALSSRE